MKKKKIVSTLSVILVLFSAFSILMVSIMAMISPQEVMALVQVPLPNNDALSSIRGVYGGVGLTITFTLVYLAIKEVQKGLAFTAILWGSYAVSRIITLLVDGPLGAFGTQWLTIESSLFVVAMVLLLITPQKKLAVSA